MPASTSGTKSPFCINTNQLFHFYHSAAPTYASTSPLLLLQLHQQQQLLSTNIINSTNHHQQHAKLRILLQHLTSHAAYERSGGPPKRPAAKRPCMQDYYTGSSITAAVVLLKFTREQLFYGTPVHLLSAQTEVVAYKPTLARPSARNSLRHRGRTMRWM